MASTVTNIRSELNEIIQEEIQVGYEASTISASIIAGKIFDEHPSEVNRYSDYLVKKAIKTMIGEAVRRGRVLRGLENKQLPLPGISPLVLQNLPAVLSIHCENGEDVFRSYFGRHPMQQAELRQGIALRQNQIVGDQLAVDALIVVLERCESLGGRDDETVIEILSRGA